MSKLAWEEIHGFISVSEYHRFEKYIANQVRNGEVLEINSDPDYGAGEIYGGQWFKDVDTGEIWRLVPPDFPFKGLWELVNH